MVEQGVITPAERAAAFSEPIRVSKRLANQHANYFVDWVDEEVRALVGETDEDLIVQTTLDLPIQASAESAVRAVAKRDRKIGVRQAALVAMDGDGRVRAMIGGTDYAENQFNRAVDARRQAGSAFKPFVYLTAFEQGRSPDTPVVDAPIKIGNWEPKNYTGSFSGGMTLERAVAQSINTVAAQIADEVGRDNVARTARRLGISTKIQTGPSMALGAVEVSPLEMAKAYAPFSNGGVYASPYGIERIRTRGGQVLYERRPTDRATVINNPALGNMNRVMRAVVTSGTGTRASVPGYDIAGKTGTTSDYKDAWFVGYTGGFTTAVWVGKDDNTAMKRVTGGNAPAEIWRTFMAAALPRLDVRPIPEGPQAPAALDDPIGSLLEAANTFFEGDAPTFEDMPLAEALPLPAPPAQAQPAQPYPGQPMPAQPYGGAPAPGPVYPPQAGREPYPGPALAAAGERARRGPLAGRLCGGGNGLGLAAQAVQGGALPLEPVAGGAGVAVELLHQRPEAGAVVGLLEMGDLVGGEVVEHGGRRGDQAPGVADRAPGRCAGAPAARGVVQRDLGYGRAESGGVHGGAGGQVAQGLAAEQVQHAAGVGVALAATEDDVAL
jgi:penicillin-binding protein 1A